MLPEFPLHLFNPPPTAKGGYSSSYEASMKWLTGTGEHKVDPLGFLCRATCLHKGIGLLALQTVFQISWA